MCPATSCRQRGGLTAPMCIRSVKLRKNVVMAEPMGLAAQATLPAPVSLPALLDAAWKAAFPGQARLAVGEDAHHARAEAARWATHASPMCPATSCRQRAGVTAPMCIRSVKLRKNVVMAEPMGLAAQATLPAPVSLPALLDAAWKAAFPGQARLAVGEDAHHAGAEAARWATHASPLPRVVTLWPLATSCLRGETTGVAMRPSPERVATAGGATNARIASSPHVAPPPRQAPRRHGARRTIAACGSPSRHGLHHGTFRANAACGRRATAPPCMITAHPAPMRRAAITARPAPIGGRGDACVAHVPCDVVPPTWRGDGANVH